MLLPILALTLAALFEVGLLLADRARLWHAAREAARVAVVDPDEGAVQAAADASGLADLDVSITPAPPGRRRGEPVTVRVGYRSPGRVPMIGGVFKGYRLGAEVTMRIEQP